MTNQEIDQLAKVLKTFIEEEREITKDMHIKHHAFIAHLIEESENNFKSYFKIRDALLGWLVMIALVGIGRVIWDYFLHTTAIIK
jgi:hypothetical protein